MHHNRKSWKPPLAAKPSHLAASTTGNSSPTAAALLGATTAFASNAKLVPPNGSQLPKQLESPSEGPSSYDERGRIRSYSDLTVDTRDVTRSPSRGRHLSPQNAFLAGARSAVKGTSPSPLPALDRTSSMIAARLASASPSPARQPKSVSPSEASSQLSHEYGKPRQQTSSPSTARPRLPASRTSSFKTVSSVPALDFDQMPTLTAKSKGTGGNQVQDPVDRNTPKTQSPEPQNKRPPFSSSLRRSADDQVSRFNDNTQAPQDHSQMTRPRPPAPAPRRGGTGVGTPLRADLTGSKLPLGLTREQAINRMADAMVASSLASTRTPSPSKANQKHSALRRSMSASSLYRLPHPGPTQPALPQRTQKPMKQTLRKTSPDEEEIAEVERRGRRHLVRKHPNMHHEGDRKRWRDKVTELERKRYEGVFAANRGLLLKAPDPRASPSRLVDPSSQSNQVVNLIVRDLWERSRLPAQVLEQIYDLVAPEELQMLNREQFVVGMWLIDQKLKGRKLPVRVSDSVWSSVRHSQGIKTR